LEHYVALFDKSPAEREELIENVVVAETWFFRDAESFCALVRMVKEQWQPENPSGQLRILSVPCSTGEEPYSLAIALLEAGLPPERFRIDAVDISALALARAREGVYGKNSFRGHHLGFRDRYFRRSDEGLVLEANIRNRVSFHRGNIIAKEFPVAALYDVIFCRNLLIYFDRETQRQAISQVRRLLVTNGLLFVGPAEQPLITDFGFEPLGIPLAFANRKWRSSSEARPTRADGAQMPVVTGDDFAGGPPNDRQPTRQAHPDLESVRSLGDAGNLTEASAVCEQYLRQHADSPQAWYLLGLIREASDDRGALECYRKALYLDPNHYETLQQMSLLAERDGNAAGARTLRSRAERLKNKTLRVT
jgi:chemotaxis protein methyltransferase WspC